jgi:hypothetical protein
MTASYVPDRNCIHLKLSWCQGLLRTRSGLLCMMLVISACSGLLAHGQQTENGLLRVGGFRCASLQSLRNDSSLDLYRTGYWNYTGFRMEVWRRLGIPFWYRRNTGVVRVAGEGWVPDLGDDVSSAEAGGKAEESILGELARERPSIDPHEEEDRAPVNAIDKDKSTSWHPPDDKHSGRLTITFAAVARITRIRFLSDGGPHYAPRDYSLGVIRPDGSTKEIASIAGEYSMGGTWREFAVPELEAKSIYIDVRSAGDPKRPPIITEFEAKGTFVSTPKLARYPASIIIPMGGYWQRR